jgi:hypothetical protein
VEPRHVRERPGDPDQIVDSLEEAGLQLAVVQVVRQRPTQPGLGRSAFYSAPRVAEVYNIGGGRMSCCSMLEAIALCQDITGKRLKWTYEESNRIGDHIWWISNLRKFKNHYPGWDLTYDVPRILTEIYTKNASRWG